MLMFKKEGGFHNFAPHEVEAAMADGWVDGEPVRAANLAAKQAPVAKVTLSDILGTRELPKRRGRPSRVEQVVVEESDNGDGTDTY